MKWQPFVPEARANAQFVLDENTGAAIDVMLCAGVKVGNSVKLGEIFATHPGHHDYEMDHYIYTHVVVSEQYYNEADSCWRFKFFADAESRNTLQADFVQVADGQMQITLTAVNNSSEEAEWLVSLLASPNTHCLDSQIENKIIRCGELEFSFGFDVEWYNSPPLDNSVPLLPGMLLKWGKHPCPPDRKYVNFFREWKINSGQSGQYYVLMGENAKAHKCNDAELCMDKLLNSVEHDRLSDSVQHLANQTLLNRSYPPRVDFTGMPEPVYTPGASFDEEYFWDAGFIALGLVQFAPEKAFKCIAQHLPEQEFSLFPNSLGSKSLIQVAAAWELYQTQRDKRQLAELYPGLHELFLYCAGCKAWPGGICFDKCGNGLLVPPGGGSGLDDAPSQVWTRGHGVGWARQNHYWAKPFPVNSTGKVVDAASVNMTAFALLSAKLLKQICGVVGEQLPNVYDDYISRAEKSLQKLCWSEVTGHFHWTISSTGEQCPYYDLSGLTPLFSGSSASKDMQELMVGKLKECYLTEYGLTTVDPKADFYRVGYWNGAVWIPFHWMFWKSLLGMGRLDDAEAVAMNVVETYAANYKKLPVCYEKFDLETGSGCGDFSFSGLASIIINLWAGYRKPGTVSTGFFIIPETVNIAEDFSSMDMEFTVNEKNGSTGILAVLKPQCCYNVTINENECSVQSDEYGCIRLQVPVSCGSKIKINVRIV
jgi:hypothetical protein